LLLLTKYYKVDKIKEDEMVQSWYTWGKRATHTRFWLENEERGGEEGAHLEDIDIYGRILLQLGMKWRA
jgi:hypothetical protein